MGMLKFIAAPVDHWVIFLHDSFVTNRVGRL